MYGDSGDLAFYTGTDRQFSVISTMTGEPLKAGAYSASLVAFSGFYAPTGGSLRIARNVSGAGVTGTFLSLGGSPESITFAVH
jgi:hypothetical protein